MTHFWTVERLEDRDLAVLEGDDGATIRVPRGWLPHGIAQGSVLRVTTGSGSQGTELSFAIDVEETRRRLARAQEQLDGLPRAPEGDLEL